LKNLVVFQSGEQEQKLIKMSINKYTLFQGNFGLKRMRFSGVANNSISLTTFIPLLTRQNRSGEETVLTQKTFSKFYSYYPQASPFVQISQKTPFFITIESKSLKNNPFLPFLPKVPAIAPIPHII
jgi:hypothetical protein